MPLNTLPGSCPKPRFRAAPTAFGEDAGRVKAEKDHEAQHEDSHGKNRLSREEIRAAKVTAGRRGDKSAVRASPWAS
jgi:hypothetical protein